MSQTAPIVEFDWRRPQTFFAVAMAVTTSPRAFFAAMPQRGGLLPPLAFLLMAHLIPALASTLLHLTSQGPGILLSMLRSLLGSMGQNLVAAVVLFIVVHYGFRGKVTLEAVIRLFCYSSGLWIVSAATVALSPATSTLVLIALVLVVLYLIQVGLQVVAGLPTLHAMLALLVTIVLVVILRMTLTPMVDPQLGAPTAQTGAPAVPGAPPPRP